MHTATPSTSLTEVKKRVDTQLTEYCDTRTKSAHRVSERYGILWESINKLVEVGGKRLRPYMLIATYRAYAKEPHDEAIIPAAMAQEFVHLAMLIHDDIIDRDTIRYGIKNIVGQYEDAYQPYINNPAERTHMTESMGILAGDVLLSEAYHLLSKVACSPAAMSQAVAILSRGIFEVIGGELLDTENAFVTDTTISAEAIARYKTASYSFISPLTMGAALAGAPETELQALKQLAKQVGIGYQLRDDLLGVFGDESTTGKSTSTDIIEGKRTYLIEQFERVATDAQRQAFFSVFHKSHASEEALHNARKLLIEAGARAAVEEKIDTLRDQSMAIIQTLSISEASKATLTELVHACLKRDF
jgi:geranylgeranyl diphosphate synthase type II